MPFIRKVRVLYKTRLIFPCMNSPNDDDDDNYDIDDYRKSRLEGVGEEGEEEEDCDSDNHHHHTKLYFI